MEEFSKRETGQEKKELHLNNLVKHSIKLWTGRVDRIFEEGNKKIVSVRLMERDESGNFVKIEDAFENWEKIED